MEKEKKKSKKKSFIGKIFSHTIKKSKKPKDEFIMVEDVSGSCDSLYGEVSLFTYCDICNNELVSDQHNAIVCHDECKKAAEKVPQPPVVEDALEFFVAADVDTVRVQEGGSRLRRAPSTLQNPSERYVFSTVDVSSMRSRGFLPRPIPVPVVEKELTIDLTMPRPSAPDDLYADFSLESLPHELKKYIDVFNSNENGLLIEANTAQLMGKLRIHINLMRPITMLLTPRPPSLYDTLQRPHNRNNSNMDDYIVSQIENESKDGNQKSMFWIDRGTTTVLYLNINSTTSDVISLLLRKFNIKNNPHRFALYLHIVRPKLNSQDVKRRRSKEYEDARGNINAGGEILFQKLRPCQCPLKIMLSWCEEGQQNFLDKLNSSRFVLQENDNGGIDWDEFSVPELKRFLSILSSQQSEKKEEITKKFELRKNEIRRLLEKQRTRRLV